MHKCHLENFTTSVTPPQIEKQWRLGDQMCSVNTGFHCFSFPEGRLGVQFLATTWLRLENPPLH
ncbi:hypothetical protein EXN66_Car019503 [Channa argus]|uniref:Uncharacterized protein n=1 Tax=Channa argus TaxID=215402 RepID=A0A6G1QMN9_CHAAH|nr:hypothetical protein EXN66_Car019503 [Channa argus]